MNTLKKALVLFAILFIGVTCKKKEKQEVEKNEEVEELKIEKVKLDTNRDLELSIPVQEIVKIKDDNEIVSDYLERKRFLKETEDFNLEFIYPYLDEGFDNKFATFNNYIKDTYLKVPELEDVEKTLCGEPEKSSLQKFQNVNYRVFLQDDWHVSILFYTASYNKGDLQSKVSFETLNFDKVNGVFLNYNDYFNTDSEEDMLGLVNKAIEDRIRENRMSKDCFLISLEDFVDRKNNFVIDNETLFYYFNDCVMCDSAVNIYKVEIPLVDILPIFKQTSINRFNL